MATSDEVADVLNKSTNAEATQSVVGGAPPLPAPLVANVPLPALSPPPVTVPIIPTTSTPTTRPSGVAAILPGPARPLVPNDSFVVGHPAPSSISHPYPQIALPTPTNYVQPMPESQPPPMTSGLECASNSAFRSKAKPTQSRAVPPNPLISNPVVASTAPSLSSAGMVPLSAPLPQPYPAVPTGPYGILAHTGQAIVFNQFGQPLGIVQPCASGSMMGGRPNSPALGRPRGNSVVRMGAPGYPLTMPPPPTLSRYAPLLPSTLQPMARETQTQPQPILPMPPANQSALFPPAVLPHPFGMLPNGMPVFKTAQGGLVALQVQPQTMPPENSGPRAPEPEQLENGAKGSGAPMVQALPPSTVASAAICRPSVEEPKITKHDHTHPVVEDAPPPLILGDVGPSDVDIRSLFMQEVEKNAPPKPGVLTHLLDGFVIQESLEPFAVNSFPYEDFIPMDAFLDSTSPDNESAASVQPPELLPEENAENLCRHCMKSLQESCYHSTAFCSKKCKRKDEKKDAKRRKSDSSAAEDRRSSSSADKNAGLLAIVTPPIRIKKSDIEPMQVEGGTPSTSTSVSATDEPSPKVPATDKHPADWTVDDVCGWVIARGSSVATTAQTFKLQEIDGQALLLLSEDHLIKSLGIKVGPAVKLCNFLTDLKRQWNMNC